MNWNIWCHRNVAFTNNFVGHQNENWSRVTANVDWLGHKTLDCNKSRPPYCNHRWLLTIIIPNLNTVLERIELNSVSWNDPVQSMESIQPVVWLTRMMNVNDFDLNIRYVLITVTVGKITRAVLCWVKSGHVRSRQVTSGHVRSHRVSKLMIISWWTSD